MSGSQITIPTTVTGLQGRGIAPSAPTNGQALVFSSGTQLWTPGAPQMGVTDGSNAAAGEVGQYLTASSASPISASNVTNVDITSLSLSPGDWNVWGQVQWNGSTSNLANLQGWVNSVSATAPSAAIGTVGFFIFIPGTANAVSTMSFSTGSRVFSISSAATVYLGGLAQFSTGTATVSGQICARRVR